MLTPLKETPAIVFGDEDQDGHRTMVLTLPPVEIQYPEGLHPAYVSVLSIHLEAIALMLAKGKGYGTAEDPFQNLRQGQAWGIPAWIAACSRAQDKLARLQAYASRGEGVLPDEGPEDNLLDMINYFTYTLLFWREYRERP